MRSALQTQRRARERSVSDNTMRVAVDQLDTLMTNQVEPLVSLATDHLCHQATEFRVLAEEFAAEMQESAILYEVDKL